MESNRVSSGNAWNRWRLVLGKNAKESLPFENANIQYVEMGNLLDFLYSRELGEDQNIREGKLGGNGGSQLTVPEWIRRVRDLFPKKTVEVLEKHALDTYGMTELVTDKEVLEKLEPNTELLKTILTFKGMMRPEVLESARRIVRTVAEELQKKMEQELRKAISGHLDRRQPSNVISARNLDIAKTIRRNLKYYDVEKQQLTVERVYFSSRVRPQNSWRLIIAVDESGSMVGNVIYSAVMAGIFARLPALDTRLIVFDTQVVDMSGYVEDPVEVMMNVQLGGGTNIGGAMKYCESLVDNPGRTIMVVVTDLYEGGSRQNLYQICRNIVESGVKLIFLTALDGNSDPVYDKRTGMDLGGLGAHVAAMTPESLADWVGEILK